MIFLIVIFALTLLAFGFEMFLVLGVPALIVKEIIFFYYTRHCYYSKNGRWN